MTSQFFVRRFWIVWWHIYIHLKPDRVLFSRVSCFVFCVLVFFLKKNDPFSLKSWLWKEVVRRNEMTEKELRDEDLLREHAKEVRQRADQGPGGTVNYRAEQPPKKQLIKPSFLEKAWKYIHMNLLRHLIYCSSLLKQRADRTLLPRHGVCFCVAARFIPIPQSPCSLPCHVSDSW